MKKYLKVFLIILCAFLVIACDNEESSTKKKKTTDQTEMESMNRKEETNVEKIISQTEDGEITEGIVEGYHFKETDKKTEQVKIQMENGGVILIVLSNSKTPNTRANFQKLVSQKFYDGIIFHRVIAGFMIQAGDPTGTGYSGSDEKIKGEFSKNGVENNLSHERGVVSMARQGGNPDTAATMNSASSQFFIVTKDSTFLDGNYAAFGKVFAGMNVVDAIETVETDSNDRPKTEQKMKSVRFVEIIKD